MRGRSGALAALLLLVLACAPAAGPQSSAPAPAPPAGTGAAPVAAPPAAPAVAAPPAATPERTTIRIGLPVDASTFLPVYLAAERTAQEEGLTIEIYAFRGDAEVAQALAADSVDVDVASVNNLINMLTAGQPVTGFYAGFHQASFSWHVRPETRGWADLRGKGAGVTTYGSLTDFLTRYALRKHGLEPERDVPILQVGPTSQALAALKGGRIELAIWAPPSSFAFEDEGYPRLSTQAAEVSEQWPQHIYFAKERFLADHPNTMRALLRAHVKAIRLAKADREAAVSTLVRALKFERSPTERTYDAIIEGFDERGLLPTRAMPVFWEIAVAAGDVTEPWPEAKLLDRRYVDTFDQWAPR
jgi:NitT/TauT family transport system substrate-binding protein